MSLRGRALRSGWPQDGVAVSRMPYAARVILDVRKDLTPKSVVKELRYSTFVSLPKRYMYFEVPKAACTSMKSLLHRLENGGAPTLFIGGPQTRREMYIHARENVPLPSLVDLDNRTQEEVLTSPDFLRFSIVRNPYTRIVSAWQNKVVFCEPSFEKIYVEIKGDRPSTEDKPLVTLEEFVEYLATKCDLATCNPHWQRQYDHLYLPALNFTFIEQVERLPVALERFRKHLGMDQPLPVSGKNTALTYGHKHHDRSLAGKLHELYRVDFETFGYDPAVWPFEAPAGSAPAAPPGPYEDRVRDEIIERNLIIAQLYAERAKAERRRIGSMLSRAKAKVRQLTW